MTVAFNPDYLSSGIEAIDSDEVTLSTMDPMKPAVSDLGVSLTEVSS